MLYITYFHFRFSLIITCNGLTPLHVACGLLSCTPKNNVKVAGY